MLRSDYANKFFTTIVITTFIININTKKRNLVYTTIQKPICTGKVHNNPLAKLVSLYARCPDYLGGIWEGRGKKKLSQRECTLQSIGLTGAREGCTKQKVS